MLLGTDLVAILGECAELQGYQFFEMDMTFFVGLYDSSFCLEMG